MVGEEKEVLRGTWRDVISWARSAGSESQAASCTATEPSGRMASAIPEWLRTGCHPNRLIEIGLGLTGVDWG